MLKLNNALKKRKYSICQLYSNEKMATIKNQNNK